ncbi:hypothetical protein NL676_011245 [Syzygium grande]|nr:hypothetical protein NL676_011245 [Syzygium grande]
MRHVATAWDPSPLPIGQPPGKDRELLGSKHGEKRTDGENLLSFVRDRTLALRDSDRRRCFIACELRSPSRLLLPDLPGGALPSRARSAMPAN